MSTYDQGSHQLELQNNKVYWPIHHALHYTLLEFHHDGQFFQNIKFRMTKIPNYKKTNMIFYFIKVPNDFWHFDIYLFMRLNVRVVFASTKNILSFVLTIASISHLPPAEYSAK